MLNSHSKTQMKRHKKQDPHTAGFQTSVEFIFLAFSQIAQLSHFSILNMRSYCQNRDKVNSLFVAGQQSALLAKLQRCFFLSAERVRERNKERCAQQVNCTIWRENCFQTGEIAHSALKCYGSIHVICACWHAGNSRTKIRGSEKQTSPTQPASLVRQLKQPIKDMTITFSSYESVTVLHSHVLLWTRIKMKHSSCRCRRI